MFAQGFPVISRHHDNCASMESLFPKEFGQPSDLSIDICDPSVIGPVAVPFAKQFFASAVGSVRIEQMHPAEEWCARSLVKPAQRGVNDSLARTGVVLVAIPGDGTKRDFHFVVVDVEPSVEAESVIEDEPPSLQLNVTSRRESQLLTEEKPRRKRAPRARRAARGGA